MMNIAILTDSTCDLPEEITRKHSIHVIPLVINWGDETLHDGRDITPDEFYRRLASDPVHPTTSQPSVGEFVEVFNRLAEEADEIVGVFISNALSGTIASAQGARDMVDIPVHIVDSYSVSLGLGEVVMAAVRAREAGLDAAAVAAAAEHRAAQTRAVIMVDTLEYLYRGGRIGGAIHWIGTLLNLKPVMHLVKGRLEPAARSRTRAGAIDQMLNVATREYGGDRPFGGAILYTTTPDEAESVAQRFVTEFGGQAPAMTQVTPVIGVHVGPGALGVITYPV